MNNSSMMVVRIYDQLDPDKAIGTMEELLQNGVGKGAFGKYLYCLKNGKQVLLGHSNPSPIGPGGRVSSTQCVFITKGIPYKRNVATWEDLKEYLEQGWIIGTQKRPGIKVWHPLTGRNYRRDPMDIYVFENGEANE